MNSPSFNSANDPLPRLPKRQSDGHKGDYGRAILIGGSRGMAGAAALSGMAALRSGAGLVRVAVAETNLDCVASFEPALMTAALPADPQGRIARAAQNQIGELTANATAVACGPGLSRSPDLDFLVAWLYTTLKQPAVFDADALNALAAQPEVLRKPGGPRVLTPHQAEFQRLIAHQSVAASQRAEAIPDRATQENNAAKLAAECGVIILLKGHRTLITDGRRQAHNTTGNPGMATGGTGDVLTGIITALLCQGLSPFDAARLGAHVHGLAGDLGAAEVGEVSLIASDLIRFLPQAFRSVSVSD